MKNTDMKVIAIILTVALCLTVLTSNVVSIASVVILAKGSTGATVEAGTNAGTSTDVNAPAGNAGTQTQTPAGNSGSTTPTQAPSGNTGATQAPSGNTGATQAPSGNTGATQAPAADGNVMAPEAALKFFQDAATDIKNNGSAAYKVKSWQEIEQINIGNEILANIIKGFVTSEDKAEVKDNAKGSDDSKNRMPVSNCTMNSVQKVSSKEVNGNYVITIVMKDQINPTEQDTDGISLMSRDLLYMSAVTNEIQNNGAIKAIVKELKTAELNYKAFTITAEMTKDGKFVSITHECHAELKAEAKLIVGSLAGDGVLCFRAKFWDFAY